MSNRVALVTGAGRGIGRSTALLMAKNGYRVGVTARTTAQLDELVDEARTFPGAIFPVSADLSDRASIAKVAGTVESHFGPIEILVNNAGIGSSQSPRPLVEFDDDFWDFTFAVNVTAPYLLCKRVLPKMLAARWGRIINIASINAKIPSLHGAAYTASKHAIAGLTKAIAKDYGDSGVTSNAVCPGVTATEMNDKRLEYDAARTGQSIADLEKGASPLGRRLLPQEVASLVVYLASDDAGAINGQSINVCGGVCYS